MSCVAPLWEAYADYTSTWAAPTENLFTALLPHFATQLANTWLTRAFCDVLFGSSTHAPPFATSGCSALSR